MRLLHISDIHFRAPQCLDPEQDEDRPIRARLVEDVARRVAELGTVTAILAGGDIAFKGDPDEYRVAGEWLDELADAAGCAREDVYVVPGNHDVDRSKCRTVAVSNAHRMIKALRGRDRTRELFRQLSDPVMGSALLEPHAAFNAFAKRYDCEVTPGKLAWIHELDLPGGLKLRLRGLTSTTLSGSDGGNDEHRDLCVGPWQTAITPSPTIVDLVMCHHPFDWLDDGEVVEDVLRNRAPLQLFGHRHRSRPDRDVGFLRLHAGAVNPDREEQGWRPCYNLLGFEIRGVGARRTIEVSAEIRELQDYPETFRATIDEHGNAIWRHSIAWPDTRPVRAAAPALSAVAQVPAVPAVDSASVNSEPVVAEEPPRDLVHLFWSRLSVSQRQEVVAVLGLLESHEVTLPEHRRYDPIWRRARERDLIPRLSAAIKQAGRG